MKRLLCLVLGFAAGYYYGQNKEKIDNDERVKKEMENLKKVKDKVLAKIKTFSKKVSKQYFSVEDQNEEEKTTTKKKVKAKSNSKKKSQKDIFLKSYCFENNVSMEEAIDMFGDLEHGCMSYKAEKIEKPSPLDFLFKRTIESLVK